MRLILDDARQGFCLLYPIRHLLERWGLDLDELTAGSQ